MAAAAQVLGCVLLCLAVGVGLGLWWGIGLAGMMLIAGGALAEATAVPGAPVSSSPASDPGTP